MHEKLKSTDTGFDLLSPEFHGLWLGGGFALLALLANGGLRAAHGADLAVPVGQAMIAGLAAARGMTYALVDAAGAGERLRFGAFTTGWSALLIHALLGAPGDAQTGGVAALAALAIGGLAALGLRAQTGLEVYGPPWDGGRKPHVDAWIYGSVLVGEVTVLLLKLLGIGDGEDRSFVPLIGVFLFILPDYRRWPVWSLRWGLFDFGLVALGLLLVVVPLAGP